jgi:hypothetical protein
MVSSEVLHDFTLAQLTGIQQEIESAGSFAELSGIAAKLCLELRWPDGFQFLISLMKHCRERNDPESFQEIAQHLVDLVEQHLIPKSSERLCGVMPKTYTKVTGR